MIFHTFSELVDEINKRLGSFCNRFQYKRKELIQADRTAENNRLFGNIKEDGWAINKGGGTELQYHITIDFEEEVIRYGLGFNTQYIPFANDKSMIDYMRPFMQAFLDLEPELKVEYPNYDFLYGNYKELLNPQLNKYVLWGNQKPFDKISTNRYFIEDTVFQEILSDLKGQFSAYIKIFSKRNNSLKMEETIKEFTDILELKNQIILQGPPGTGKTYTAKDIAEQLIRNEVSIDKKVQKDELEKSGRFKLIQFHPAYSYEDFVRGITIENIGNQIEYKTKNKLLGEFALKALRNYLDSLKSSEVLSKEAWLDIEFDLFVDGIKEQIAENGPFPLNETVSIFSLDTDAFRYSGKFWKVKNTQRMKFNDIKAEYLAEVSKAIEIKEIPGISGRAKDHIYYDFLVLEKFREYLKNRPEYSFDLNKKVELKNYVLIIDEINRANLPSVLGELIYALEYRGESVESMYELEDGGNALVLPKNLFIIGTMNTADRSVGHIDYAIRRRFAFKSILPSSKVIESVIQDPIKQKAITLYNDVKALFTIENLAPDFKADDVQLGHSYFLASTEDKLKLKLDYEIKPLLSEYLKDGILLTKTNIPIPGDKDHYLTEDYIEGLKVI